MSITSLARRAADIVDTTLMPGPVVSINVQAAPYSADEIHIHIGGGQWTPARAASALLSWAYQLTDACLVTYPCNVKVRGLDATGTPVEVYAGFDGAVADRIASSGVSLPLLRAIQTGQIT